MHGQIRPKITFLTFVLLSAFATCNAQQVDKSVVIESLIASTREIIASPDSPSMRMALEPVKNANMAVPEPKWQEFQASVVAIMREEILKAGSPAYVKLKTRLQLLSVEEVVELNAMLRSPTYKKYQMALADREISEGTLGALMAAWSRIADSAKQSGIRIN
jgi:hypothetical protein